MTTDNLASNTTRNELPSAWHAEVEAQLAAGENALTTVEVDLDAKLRFVKGLVVLTDRRLLARAPGEIVWRDWPFRAGLLLTHHDHAGVGHMEILDGSGRLACWRFTLGQNLLATRLIDQFKLQLTSHVSGQPIAREEQNVCPSCKAPLAPDQDECPICTKVIHTPPSTWTLFRLWRFAKPYRGQLLAGFILTLLGTAANMVPPYLTIPLMDVVLGTKERGD